MATSRGQRVWRVIEVAITLIVILVVGWQFATMLRNPELWDRSLHFHWGWVACSTLLYLAGISTSGIYWHYVLHRLGQRPASLLAKLRAYYIGQMGRYVPGKVVGVIWRSRLLRGPQVHGGVA